MRCQEINKAILSEWISGLTGVLLEKEKIIFFEAHVLLNMQAFLDITDLTDCEQVIKVYCNEYLAPIINPIYKCMDNDFQMISSWSDVSFNLLSSSTDPWHNLAVQHASWSKVSSWMAFMTFVWAAVLCRGWMLLLQPKWPSRHKLQRTRLVTASICRFQCSPTLVSSAFVSHKYMIIDLKAWRCRSNHSNEQDSWFQNRLLDCFIRSDCSESFFFCLHTLVHHTIC